MSNQSPQPYDDHSAQSGGPVHPFDRQPASSEAAPPPPDPQRRGLRVEFPYGDPVLVYAILAVNILVFLGDMVFGGLLTQIGAKNNSAILAGEYWRLVTPLFLHGGIIHLGFNSYFLYIVGRSVERYFGSVRFAVIYFLSGVTGSMLSFAFSQYNSIGASGALFGVIGAWVPLLYRNRDVLANTGRQIRRIVQVIGINLLIGLMPGIDNWAHLGGLIGGLALGWIASPRYEVQSVMADRVQLKDRSEASIIWFLMGLFAGLLALVMQGLLFLRR